MAYNGAYHSDWNSYDARYSSERQGNDSTQQGSVSDSNYQFNDMASPGNQEPKLGATFYPGGYDDFLMPELISPSPQRVMSELPANMQDDLARLELEANDATNHKRRTSSVPVVSPLEQSTFKQDPQQRQHHEESGPRGYTAKYEHTNASAYQNIYKAPAQGGLPKNYSNSADDPFPSSPFPKLRDAAPNVPPSDDEKEEVLERARPLVLKSEDPEMQLAWAQDALLWVEAAVQCRIRLAGDQPPRPGTPKVEHGLRVDAISIINFLAQQHHPKAEFLKATWYEFGKFGYPLDRKEAFQAYRRAAEKGYARAEYRIGTQYEGMQDMGKAIKHYSIGVSMGDSASNYRLGMMSLLGQHGQPHDYRLGMDRIHIAAETADENAPQGAYIYGMLLARELPNITVPEHILPIDIDQARLFVEKAAYLGFAKAQQKMGQAYELCLMGCEFNPALSLHYNALAARQGEPEAEMAISKWFLCGFEGIFEKNEQLAFTYAQRAAASGLATAEFALGYFYEIGMYERTDLRLAKEWYQKAADHGNKDAGGRLESISQHKTLSKKDHEQIAITRIKSQYGSMKGRRPERLKDRQSPMPKMPEERVSMPEPRISMHSSSMSGTLLGAPGDAQLPPRPKSAAPYPDDDDVRLGHGFNPALGQRGGPIADRPMSAFGIKAYNAEQQHVQDFSGPARPSTSLGNVAVPEGRGSNPAARHRVVSAGPVSTGWESQPPSGYRQQPVASPPPMPLFDGNWQQQYDSSHGGRNKLQKQDPNMPNMGKPQPPLPHYPAPNPGYPVTPQTMNAPLYHPVTEPNYQTHVNSHAATPPAVQTRYDSLPNRPQSYARQDPPQGYDRQFEPHANPHRSDRHDSIPPNPSSHLLSGSQQSSTSQFPPRSSSAAPSSSSAASSKPMKEGPKTFDEMGIPAKKDESDCCIM